MLNMKEDHIDGGHKLAAENARYRDELAQLQHRIEQQQAWLGQLSHQLRSPLTTILGYAELMKHAEAFDSAQLDCILSAAGSLAAIIHDLPLQKAGEPLLAPFNMATLVPQLQSAFAYDAQSKGLDYQVQWDRSIPESLYGDSPRLRHILLILTHNALRFTEEGAVVVRFTLQSLSDQEATIAIDVTDTGQGIAAARQATLFTPPAPTPRRFGRAGNNLALAAEMVRSLGGELAVASREGEGSRFHFALPLRVHHPHVQPIEQAARHSPSLWQHMRLLLVDDDAMARELLEHMAKRLGIGTVDTAENGAAALALVERQHYDLVLMDCQMPAMDGFTATRSLRQHMHRSLPVIGITADVLQADTAKCYAAGMDDYYTKPLSLARLEQIFHKWLEPSPASSA